MIIQTYRTTCDDCGNEIISKAGNMTGDDSIIIDFLEDMEFECECGTTTYLQIEKHTK